MQHRSGKRAAHVHSIAGAPYQATHHTAGNPRRNVARIILRSNVFQIALTRAQIHAAILKRKRAAGLAHQSTHVAAAINAHARKRYVLNFAGESFEQARRPVAGIRNVQRVNRGAHLSAGNA